MHSHAAHGCGYAFAAEGNATSFRDFKVPEKDQTHFVLNEETGYLQSVCYLDKALAKRTKPDCLVCGNDRVALIAYQHLLSRGLRIPGHRYSRL
jgi:DNA-binding LacI/PurR family transcriptional regulator